MQDNPQLDLAYRFTQHTGCSIFLTGKAGTGKTTFLHRLKNTALKRMAVLAPTGVAAINAGGTTIHSFFQLPFGPFVPGAVRADDGRKKFQKFNREKIALIQGLDLLVIDEISMVRADTLDAIDEVLRRYRQKNKPFGGVQLLMIGDLHQLTPVVREEEWSLLRPYYQSPYFFSSKALQSVNPVTIGLTHIYRQSDQEFIDLLNQVRENRISAASLARLNQRYLPGFGPEEEAYITLTTHNRDAKTINAAHLDELGGKLHCFDAAITGDFPQHAYPADAALCLKTGSQVMFIKNDPSREKLFYNGKIGRVTHIDEEKILVRCPGEADEIEVAPAEWQNLNYELDNSSKEIEERIAGTFSQFPLRLAWAITIHKSQGLTFDKVIIDAGASFAHGQVYVALSRCKSLEGIVLRSPIAWHSIKTDPAIAAYTRQEENNQPGTAELLKARNEFQQHLLLSLFDLDDLKRNFFICMKIIQDQHASLEPTLLSQLEAMKIAAEKEIYPVSENFRRQLVQLFGENVFPEENQLVTARVAKACAWFGTAMQELFGGSQLLLVETDNKETRKTVTLALNELRKELFVKSAAFRFCESGFDTMRLLRARTDAALDFELQNKKPQKTASPAGITDRSLYDKLKAWRDAKATEEKLPVYRILAQKTLAELAARSPANYEELLLVKGIGKQKAAMFGKELLLMINGSYDQTAVPGSLAREQKMPGKQKKEDTKAISFRLFKEGRTIARISQERGMADGTIAGHLAYYAGIGELDPSTIIAAGKVNSILSYLEVNQLPANSLTALKLAMGDEYSFSELKLVLAYFAHLKNRSLS